MQRRPRDRYTLRTSEKLILPNVIFKITSLRLIVDKAEQAHSARAHKSAYEQLGADLKGLSHAGEAGARMGAHFEKY